MSKSKLAIATILVACALGTGLVFHHLGKIDPIQIQYFLHESGSWAPVAYVSIYVLATVLVLPSTALNLTGGAIFGTVSGTFWTSVGALLAAVISFSLSRTVSRNFLSKRLEGKWQLLDAELRQGGLFYMFAIRLIPIMPYGLVNFVAGLTSINFRDYFIGTALGTVPSVLPFVMLGSSGIQAIQTGKVFPLIGSLALIGVSMVISTWYRRRSFSRIVKNKRRKDHNSSN